MPVTVDLGSAGAGVTVTTQSDDLYRILSGNLSTEAPLDDGNMCETIDADYNIPTAVICAMCFVFGIVYTFFGKYVSKTIYSLLPDNNIL